MTGWSSPLSQNSWSHRSILSLCVLSIKSHGNECMEWNNSPLMVPLFMNVKASLSFKCYSTDFAHMIPKYFMYTFAMSFKQCRCAKPSSTLCTQVWFFLIMHTLYMNSHRVIGDERFMTYLTGNRLIFYTHKLYMFFQPINRGQDFAT